MTWLGCQEAVSELWRDAGLQGLSEGLGAAELVLGISASEMEQLALSQCLSGKRQCCKPCLYGILFENKNKLSKKCSPEAKI